MIIEGLVHACGHLAVGQALQPLTRQSVRHEESGFHTRGHVTHTAKALGQLNLAVQLGTPMCNVIRDLLKATWPIGGPSVAPRLACPLPHTAVQARGSDVDSDRCCHLGTLGAGGLAS